MNETGPSFSSKQPPVESSPVVPQEPGSPKERLERFVRKCFVGPTDIRAGWRLAIYLLIVVGLITGVFRFGTIGLHGLELFEYAVLWGLAFLFVGLFEEFFFRGYALFTLTTGMTFWPSAILLSAIFGLIHHGNPGESWAGALEAGVTGLLFCFLLRQTGNLWMPIGFHAAWDWGEDFFYGVPGGGYHVKGHLFNPTFAVAGLAHRGKRWT